MKSPTYETQIRAARELLRWDQQKLADEAGLSLATVKRYESAREGVSDETAADLVAALERAGILFIGKTSINGVSVAGAVAIRSWAKPKGRPPTRDYKYAKPAGRPKGSKNKKSTVTGED